MSGRRWWSWLLGLVLVAFAVRFAMRFPWADAGRTLLEASLPLLLFATAVNLVSLVAKALAWHVLLRSQDVPRWRSSLEATVIGAAVNAVGIAASGDAARAYVVMEREPVGLGRVVASLAWSRVVEAVGLALVLGAAGALLDLPAWLRPVRWVLLGLLILAVALATSGAWRRLLAIAPERTRRVLSSLGSAVPPGRLAGLALLGIVNWLTQWATYHLAAVAVVGDVPVVTTFVALLAANLGGLPKLTPGNVGILQAAFVLGLGAAGVPADRAIAAGLACQALQVLPVLLLGVVLAGWRGLRTVARASVDESSLAISAPESR